MSTPSRTASPFSADRACADAKAADGDASWGSCANLLVAVRACTDGRKATLGRVTAPLAAQRGWLLRHHEYAHAAMQRSRGDAPFGGCADHLCSNNLCCDREVHRQHSCAATPREWGRQLHPLVLAEHFYAANVRNALLGDAVSSSAFHECATTECMPSDVHQAAMRMRPSLHSEILDIG